MPKQKSHRGLMKRIKISGTGKIMRHHAYTGHLKANKTVKQNRQLSGETTISPSDIKRIKGLY